MRTKRDKKKWKWKIYGTRRYQVVLNVDDDDCSFGDNEFFNLKFQCDLEQELEVNDVFPRQVSTHSLCENLV